MKRVSRDYIAIGAGKCEICQRQILPGMYVFQVELKSGRLGTAHSICETELKSKTGTGVSKRE